MGNRKRGREEREEDEEEEGRKGRGQRLRKKCCVERKWNRWDDMLYSRTFFGCVVLPSNDILCVGGKKSNEYQTTCEILDIRANKWRIASSMNQIRHAVPHSTAGKVVGRRCRGYTVTLL